MHRLSPQKSKVFEQWLGGLSLERKIQSLETGDLFECCYCRKVFFDRDSEMERKSIRCISSKVSHDCRCFAQYVILKRGFRGIFWSLIYWDQSSLKESIIDFFRNGCVQKFKASSK